MNGHSRKAHFCPEILTAARVDADECMSGSDRVDGASGSCQQEDDWELVEVVEVVTNPLNNDESTRAPVTRKQYINLDARVDPGAAHPEYGRSIPLKARIRWLSGDRSRSLAGKTVHWKVTADSDNRQDLSDSRKATIAGGARANEPTGTSTTNADGWTDIVPFETSSYGGDEFSVTASQEADGRGENGGTYKVWRKFWYQVTEMTDRAGTGRYEVNSTITRRLARGFRTVFIEVEEEGPRTTAAHVRNARTSSDRSRVVRPHTRNTKVPFKFHICTLDWADESGTDTEIIGYANQRRWTVPNWHFLDTLTSGPQGWLIEARARYGDGSPWFCGRTIPFCMGHSLSAGQCEDTEEARWKCNAEACPGVHSDPGHTCSSGPYLCNRLTPICEKHDDESSEKCPQTADTKWSCGAFDCPGHDTLSENCESTWRPLPASAVSISQTDSSRPGYKRVRIDFTGTGLTPTRATPVGISLRLRLLDSQTLGWGGGTRTIYLATGMLRDAIRRSEHTAFQASDIVHELGHALGLVNMVPAAPGEHDAWDDTVDPRNSHPNHCRKPPAECAMWWASSADRATTFHTENDDGCHIYLRRQEFDRSVMARRWRFV